MVDRRVRYGDFVGESAVHYKKISFNELTYKPTYADDGELIPYVPPEIKLNAHEITQLLTPYVSVRFIDQVKSVVPLALYLVVFQILILRVIVDEPMIITAGFCAVIVGLMLFLEGIKQGLMPFGEAIGDLLPARSPLAVVMLITFLLGIGVTLAEPAIGALKAAGANVDVKRAPYLYALLNFYTTPVVLAIGAGVGVAAVLGSLRFLYGWSLKPFIYSILVVVLGLTSYMMIIPDLTPVLGLAWDCGAVTTGPVTVPIILSLGIGIASSAGKGGQSLSGFGIVTMASLLPVIGVQILALYTYSSVTIEEISSMAAAVSAAPAGWMDTTPVVETILGFRAIVPLVLFMFFIMAVILREKVRNAGYIVYGITLSVVGIIIFNIGLSYGLVKLGNQAGSMLPSAFAKMESIAHAPLYGFPLGLFIALLFAWFLGFSATMAEPALNALGMTVENLTNGAFKKRLLLYTVSLGVAFGITIGLLKIVFEIPLGYLLLPGYVTAIILTFQSNEEFVNVAWDSAGVTTGPVTVPLVLAMGLGFGDAVSAIEGFGILAMASIGPILSVLTMGLIVQRKVARSHARR